MRRSRVTQRHQFSVFIRTDGKSLLGARALTGGIKHLRSRERQFHRSLHQFRCCSCEHGMAPLESFRAKCATDEWANNMHIFARQTEDIRDDSLQLFDPAGRFMNKQAIRRLPFCRGRICLDRIVIFDWRGIDNINLVRSSRERGIYIAAFHLERFAPDESFRPDRIFLHALVIEHDNGRLWLVGHTHE